MSGGAMNYLYSRDVEDLLVSISDLQIAEGYLLRNNYEDVAKDVRRLIEYIKTARNRLEVLQENLSDVFKAIEWAESGDWSKDSVEKAVEAYRNK